MIKFSRVLEELIVERGKVLKVYNCRGTLNLYLFGHESYIDMEGLKLYVITSMEEEDDELNIKHFLAESMVDYLLDYHIIGKNEKIGWTNVTKEDIMDGLSFQKISSTTDKDEINFSVLCSNDLKERQENMSLFGGTDDFHPHMIVTEEFDDWDDEDSNDKEKFIISETRDESHFIAVFYDSDDEDLEFDMYC